MNFLKKIFSPFCLIISLLLLIYTFYRSEIYWNGEKSDFYKIYYILFFLLFIFSVFTFFINKKIKEYLIISLISITLSLYIFETYLTFFAQAKHEKKRIYEKENGKKYDMRSTYKIYKDLKKINKEIKLTVSPTNYIKEDNKFYALFVNCFSNFISCCTT